MSANLIGKFGKMLCGLDQLLGADLSSARKRLRDGRFAILTHAAAVDRRGRNALTVLEELGAAPTVIFSPEHGFDGLAQAEEPVLDPSEADLPAPVISLYRADVDSLKPHPEKLAGLDLLVIDLVDVGSRYYTFVWTALLAARAAQAAGVHTLVLDRPNPISG
ncbi:MAG TPA: exo-beta-N-acetylmuramidase NamZ domain-containing protein, partial [Polyangiaceae bacterium]